MSDIFISYARVDADRIASVAGLLQQRGFSVWWDDAIHPGEDFRDRIRKALREARCVIVAWSGASIESRWVIDEAEEALHRRILIPLLIDPVLSDIPHGFRGLQAADLSGWSGDASDPAWQKLEARIATLLEGPIPREEPGPRQEPGPREKPGAPQAAPQPIRGMPRPAGASARSAPTQAAPGNRRAMGCLLLSVILGLGGALAAFLWLTVSEISPAARRTTRSAEPVRDQPARETFGDGVAVPAPARDLATDSLEGTPVSIASGCRVTIRNPLVSLSETPSNRALTGARVPVGTYTVLAGRVVTWAGQPQRWFQIEAGGRRGWIRDSRTQIDGRSSACP